MLSTVLAAALLLAATLSPAFSNPSSVPTSYPTPPIRTVVPTVRHLADTLDSADSLPSMTGMAGDDLAADEREFVERINAERTERGLYALTTDPILMVAARCHCGDMCAHSYFNHVCTAAGLRTPMDRYLNALHADGQKTPGSLLVGENIYYCSLSRPGRDVLMGHQALMNSPGHRANILDPRFARVGVGIYRDASGQIWVTEMFLRSGSG